MNVPACLLRAGKAVFSAGIRQKQFAGVRACAIFHGVSQRAKQRANP
jgi:hypothetical protein